MIEKSLYEPVLTFGDLVKRSGVRLMMMAVGVFTAVTLLMVVGWWVSTAVAASNTPQTTFTVTTNADTNDGSCDTHCTLREAINSANSLPAPDVIVFNLPPLSQTITLNSQLPAITDSLTIEGSAVPSLTISGNNLYRAFLVYPGISTTLTSMSIISGFSGDGGGILIIEGSLTLNHVTLRGNTATGSFGGGVKNYHGSLFVYNSAFINNSAEHGGGIFNEDGTLVVSDSYFRGNEVSGLGGGIAGFYGPVVAVVSNTIFVDNMAAYGGGIVNGGMLTLTHSTFSHNAASVYGGGMLNTEEAVVTDTTFFSNTAGHSGGAILNDNSLFLSNSTFNENRANQHGGAVANHGQFFSATLTVTNSLFQRNVAGSGGGIAGWTGYKVDIRNSTLSSNTAITAGGGISNSNLLQLNNVTVSDNEAAVGGGINSSGAMTMSNSIVANSIGGDCANSGLFNTNVNNLVEDGSCNPMLSGDPLMGPLADNGGETWTHALLPGSLAIDSGDNAICELTDQRGVMRPIDGNGDGTAVCDIGAVEQEFAPTPTPTVTATPSDTPTPTNTPTPTDTSTPTYTPTPTFTPTSTVTDTPTNTPTPTTTSTPTPSTTPMPTATPPPLTFWIYLPTVLTEG